MYSERMQRMEHKIIILQMITLSAKPPQLSKYLSGIHTFKLFIHTRTYSGISSKLNNNNGN